MSLQPGRHRLAAPLRPSSRTLWRGPANISGGVSVTGWALQPDQEAAGDNIALGKKVTRMRKITVMVPEDFGPGNLGQLLGRSGKRRRTVTRNDSAGSSAASASASPTPQNRSGESNMTLL